jgi:putative hydrolase of the HAD superfamily
VSVIRSVIFDLGGTLVDFRSHTSPTGDGVADWRNMEERGITALYRFLIERGYTLPVQDPLQGKGEFSEAMWNIANHAWGEAMAGRANGRLLDIIAATVARFGMVFDDETQMQAARVYTAGVGDGAFPLDGARETLRELKERGLRLGLLSNTMWPSQFHEEELIRFGLIEFLDVLVFSCEVGLWKPNAPAFRYVIGRLGVSPSEAVFVGDQPPIDVVGAQSAGLRAVWIATDGIELGDVHPDAVIYRLAELPDVLDNLQ